MPIGSCTYEATSNPLKRLFRQVFGTPELHSHFRLQPMLDYVKNACTLRAANRIRVLELGCGGGINLFELAVCLPGLQGVGYDLDPQAIAFAQRTAKRLFPERLSFALVDICREDVTGEFDMILLMDVLEHVPNPGELLRRASGLLRPGGEVLVSVPTPRYARVFGRDFHHAVGHLVDGYDLNTLDPLVPASLRRVSHHYSTGLVALVPCALYYRVLRKLSGWPFVKLLSCGLQLFKWVDFFNGPLRSCSLFAAYQKV